MNTQTFRSRPNLLETGSPLFCDFYHLTMAQTWFLDGKAEEHKVSEAFFRKCPFGGSYLMAAGLGEFLQWIDNWHFSDEDIADLRTYTNADGTPVFCDEFIDFVKGKTLKVNINALKEGEIVFPNEPVYSISGPNWQVEIVEAALLNIFNPQSLIATKASRMALASSADNIKRSLLEFGLRRDHELGGFTETRAAFIGGATATSNTKAARHYNIPAAGTMAHSFIMSYEKELDAFKAYMWHNPSNTTLLVDTYDTRQGIQNAIQASLDTKIPLMGIRIDSGDLAYWGKEARRMLDDAGFNKTKLVASNDLDEHLIENLLLVQKAPYDIMAAGTKLVTAYDTPALGGVFKTKSYLGKPKIKVAEGKTTIPGATNVIRIEKNGQFNGDIICKAEDEIIKDGEISRNLTSYTLGSTNQSRITFAKGEKAHLLLSPVVREGKIIVEPELDLRLLQQRGHTNLAKFDEAYKRLVNPHVYGVGLEAGLFALQQNLIQAHRTM